MLIHRVKYISCIISIFEGAIETLNLEISCSNLVEYLGIRGMGIDLLYIVQTPIILNQLENKNGVEFELIFLSH